jgi:hypothetical protein
MFFHNFKALFNQEELEEGILDDYVHDAKSMEATSINNEGIDNQLTYLIQVHGQEALADFFGLKLDKEPSS